MYINTYVILSKCLSCYIFFYKVSNCRLVPFRSLSICLNDWMSKLGYLYGFDLSIVIASIILRKCTVWKVSYLYVNSIIPFTWKEVQAGFQYLQKGKLTLPEYKVILGQIPSCSVFRCYLHKLNLLSGYDSATSPPLFLRFH